MIFKKEISPELLPELFESDDKCLELLAQIKWEDGFVCRKCGNTNFCPGKAPHARRCTRCKSEESATAGTVFHHCRFSLSKAFYIAYSVCKGKQDISTYEFARKLSLRQMTCWKFKDRIRKAIEASGELPENWVEILS
jgi:hypothetical protein